MKFEIKKVKEDRRRRSAGPSDQSDTEGVKAEPAESEPVQTGLHEHQRAILLQALAAVASSQAAALPSSQAAAFPCLPTPYLSPAPEHPTIKTEDSH